MLYHFINVLTIFKKGEQMSEEKQFTIHTLSTKDNPFNPFDEYDQWFAFDHECGYNSSEYLARLAHTSDYLSPEQNEIEIEKAIDDIIRNDPTGNYIKVSKTIE